MENHEPDRDGGLALGENERADSPSTYLHVSEIKRFGYQNRHTFQLNWNVLNF